VRRQEQALLQAEASACALAKMQMCLLCGGCPSKMVLKNMRWKKNKKHWVGLSVGSNVLLKYGLYVVCHLSKWFTFSSLFNGHFLLCRVVIRLQLTLDLQSDTAYFNAIRISLSSEAAIIFFAFKLFIPFTS
jgi:uncharacterized membrane protein HdeD (DUF308 family)